MNFINQSCMEHNLSSRRMCSVKSDLSNFHSYGDSDNWDYRDDFNGATLSQCWHVHVNVFTLLESSALRKKVYDDVMYCTCKLNRLRALK